VTDDTRNSAQARRMDGQPWQLGPHPAAKALFLAGSKAAWPVGLSAIQACHQSILLVEGGPDLLAAHAYIWMANRKRDAAAVAMLGAQTSIPSHAIPTFRGRRVRIVAHSDDVGWSAAQRWARQILPAVHSVDILTLGTLRRRDGRPVKDLNDAFLLDADAFERARMLHSLVP
jgi:hypothetical protein